MYVGERKCACVVVVVVAVVGILNVGNEPHIRE
jgi:hypothetical protein